MNCGTPAAPSRSVVRVVRERADGMTNDRLSDIGPLAWFAAGKRTKWLIVVFWVVVLAASMGAASKLTGQQDNDSASWLPGEAESTQVLDRMAPFQSPNEIPA